MAVHAYAVMSNHVHVVLSVDPQVAHTWPDEEVARRWLRVYPGHRVIDDCWIEPDEDQVRALAADKDRIGILRKRLSDISWFMAALSEYIARRSNLEDSCSGRFWSIGLFSCTQVQWTVFMKSTSTPGCSG